jgi:hypothetical protein
MRIIAQCMKITLVPLGHPLRNSVPGPPNLFKAIGLRFRDGEEVFVRYDNTRWKPTWKVLHERPEIPAKWTDCESLDQLVNHLQAGCQ